MVRILLQRSRIRTHPSEQEERPRLKSAAKASYDLGSLRHSAFVGSAILAFLEQRETAAALYVDIARFAVGAAAGWVILWMVFRLAKHSWLSSAIGLGALAVAIVVSLRVSPITADGMVFGAMIVWWPHCWQMGGVRPTEPNRFHPDRHP